MKSYYRPTLKNWGLCWIWVVSHPSVIILFPINILRTKERVSPNFVNALILTRSRFGLLHIIFRTFLPELWPLIYAKILFLLNILRTNSQNFTKFCICIDIDKI